MEYTMKWVRGHVEVYDRAGRFLFSAGGVRETVNPPYAAIIRRIVFCMIFKLADGE